MRRTHHDELTHALVSAELLDVVEADEAAHRMTDDVDLLHRGLSEDRFDLAMDEERGSADVANVERPEVEREHTQAVVVQTAFEDVHRAARPEVAVDEQHGRARLVDGIEECFALDAIAASEMPDVGQRVLRAVKVVADGGVDAPQPDARSFEQPRKPAEVRVAVFLRRSQRCP